MLAACLALVGALAAGATAMAATDVIRGSATYRERIALPPGTTLEVELLDVSKADAPAVVIASDSQPVLRQVPIAFALTYDPALVDPENSYALAARLVNGGETIFRSTAITPVLAQGADATPEILLVKTDGQAAGAGAGAPGQPASPTPAAETPADMAAVAGTWIAAEINGAPTDPKVVSWLKLSDEGRAQGQGGCNGYSGTFKLEDGVMSVGPLASTMRACPEPKMSQEQRFFTALEAAKGALIEGEQLVLVDLKGDPLVRLHRK
ncbi:MAG: YbaY family lipoprotein [Amaricoccus sp.]|uniref:YbaY family lipoprotein n=1 Tax=Amaricoccus sp. TaxID=1872485 RepID=UPI0039E571B4